MKAEVSIVQCTGYRKEEVRKSLRECLKQIGGLKGFILPGDEVLLKPNLLSPHPPEEGITTHPAVVEAVAQWAKGEGGKVYLGDSPSGVVGKIEDLWEITGMKEVARKTGVKLISFEQEELAEITLPQGSVLKEIRIPSFILRCKVINLPKLKTHNITYLTGGVKNMLGVIPGLAKAMVHGRAPSPEEFARVLVDIFSRVKPALTIMDAVVSMEGNGPTYGNLRQTGLLMAGFDTVALDVIASLIMGLSPKMVPTLQIAGQRNLGIVDEKRIVVKGVPWEKVKVEDFRLPTNTYLWRLPPWFLRWLGRSLRVRPVVKKDLCRRCHLCVKSCPVKAMDCDRRDYPRVDYSLCILCLCCYEVCPYKAVGLKRSLIARLTIPG